MPSKFEIIFFESGQSKPPEKFLLSLPEKTIAKALRLFDLLEKYGPQIGFPYVKKVSSQLWELRIKGQNESRFFFTVLQKKIFILHGFRKKTQKIPPKEIRLAQKRLTDL
ncbi:type II toxin-antitoxin system RelE/ParE family toxin [Patescibacteria group bacterium]